MPLPPRPSPSRSSELFDVPITLSDTEPSAAPSERSPETPTLSSLAAQIADLAAAQHVLIRRSTPPPEPPRSSMRAAVSGVGQAGKWGVYASGALSLLGSVIVWVMRPEYAAPLGQALKLIAQVILAASGGAPAPEAAPARDVPALAAPAPAPLPSPVPPPDAAP